MRTIGELIDLMHEKAQEIKAAKAAQKALEGELEALKAEALERSAKEGVTQFKSNLAMMTIVEKVLPNVQDWDRFYAFIHENRFYHLLQRRPSVPGCAELFDAQGDIPGVAKFTKKDVTIRSL